MAAGAMLWNRTCRFLSKFNLIRSVVSPKNAALCDTYSGTLNKTIVDHTKPWLPSLYTLFFNQSYKFPMSNKSNPKVTWQHETGYVEQVKHTNNFRTCLCELVASNSPHSIGGLLGRMDWSTSSSWLHVTVGN